MKKYKITNLKTNIIQFMNEKEKENFMQINNKNNSYYSTTYTIKLLI